MNNTSPWPWLLGTGLTLGLGAPIARAAASDGVGALAFALWPTLIAGGVTPTSVSATLVEVRLMLPFEYAFSAPFSGTPSGGVYVVVEDPDRVFTAGYAQVSGSTATITLRFNRDVGAGHYTRPLVLHACKDAACTQEYPGSPQTVRKDFMIEGVLVSPSRLDFSAAAGVGTAAQTVSVTLPAGKAFSIGTDASVEYTPPGGSRSMISRAGVFTVARTPSGLSVQPLGVAAGLYHWSVLVASDEYEWKYVDVVYQVAGS